jgi:4-amino-4-deoxy-L-arabinose transferase-like glycosyltransferase
LLVLLGTMLRIADLPLGVHSPDEDTYVRFYAAPLVERGPGHVAELVRDYNARKEMHEYPPPTRVGHLWMLWAAMLAAGRADVEVASALSCIVAIAGLLGMWWLASMAAGPWVAVIALGFAATSPLERAMSRRAWGDGPLAVATVFAMACLARAFRRPERMTWGLFALACAVAATLIKESGAAVLAVVTLALAVHGWRTGGPRRAATWLVAGAIAAALAAGIVAMASGGIGPLRLALHNAESTRATNRYMIEYLNGGVSLYFRGFWMLQPLPIFLGLAAALVLIVWRGPTATRDDARATQLALIALVAALFVPALLYPSKNMRFLSPIYPALEILAATLLVNGFAALRPRVPARAFQAASAALALVLALSALREHQRFEAYFVAKGVPDLATPWLTKP